MNLAVSSPALLLLLPLALLPLFRSAQRPQSASSLDGIESDPLSVAIDWTLRIAGAVAITALILGIAGLHRLGRTIEKTGEGAHIVLLIDRSSSMDDTFAGRQPDGGEESKSYAAKRLLKEGCRSECTRLHFSRIQFSRMAAWCVSRKARAITCKNCPLRAAVGSSAR